MAIRLQKEFALRETFEAAADVRRDALLSRRGITEDMQINAHTKHLKRVIQEREGRLPLLEEMNDVISMLRQRGVAPLSESMQNVGAELRQRGKASGTGLWHIVQAFRSEEMAKSSYKKKTNKQKKSVLASEESTCLTVIRDLLKEHGYPDVHIRQALSRCGPHLPSCVDYCIKLSTGHVDDTDAPNELHTEEIWCAARLQSLGFDVKHVTQVLENNDFSFSKTLAFFLNGGDCSRDIRRFRRHTRKMVFSLNLVEVAGHSVREEYLERVKAVPDYSSLAFRVVDLGQHAFKTTGACFWLCLAAGLSRCQWSGDAHALPGISDCYQLLSEVRAMPLVSLDGANREAIEHTSLGIFAYKLRQHMCAGPTAVLLREDVMANIYAAFAGLEEGSATRTLTMYKAWVQKLATKEYADELVVSACAREFKIRIVCIPYTPQDVLPKWMISQYQPSDEFMTQDQTIFVGNNDVHYMWLATR